MIQKNGKVAAIIAAAGAGIRFGKGRKKQYRHLGGLPVLSHTVMAFESCDAVNEIFLVIPAADRRQCQEEVLAPLPLKKAILLVEGGKERQESVLRGLEATGGRFGYVAIHDGVRPLVAPETISSCIEKAMACGACIPVQSISETVKEVDGKEVIRFTMDRKRLRLAQTPQVFRYELIWNAHVTAAQEGYQGTDDAELVERLGAKVETTPGSYGNIKITTPDDLAFADALWKKSTSDRDPTFGPNHDPPPKGSRGKAVRRQ